MKYILSNKTKGCVLCDKVAENDDKKNHILHRGRTCCVMLNLYPYNNGHLMIAPYQHVPSLEMLEEETLIEMMLLVSKCLVALRQCMNPQGFNLGVNIGKAAGAGVYDHVHFHIVPRWEGDTNFMPILAETRVIPELLDDTYDQLKAHLCR
jgi:ATP adenylyltransferase